MQNYKIPIKKALTDSLSLSIPLDCCTVIDKKLLSERIVVYPSLITGNETIKDMYEYGIGIDEEILPPKPLVYYNNGKKIRISLLKMPFHNKATDKKKLRTYINLTVSAKLLNEKYFYGINKQNIKTIYDSFIDYNVFTCSFDDFLNGICNDVDVCFNLYASTLPIYVDILNDLYNHTGTRQKYVRQIKEVSNVGMSFHERRFAVPSLPFIKFYHKELELLNNSADFWNTYLFKHYASQIKGLTRVECTIKNFEHKKRLNRFKILPIFKTLKEYLEFTERELMNFCAFSISSWIEKRFYAKSPNLSPSNHLLFQAITHLINAGYDSSTILRFADSFEGANTKSEEVAKSRMRKNLKELLDLNFALQPKLKTKANYNAHIIEYLTSLGIDFGAT